MMPPNNDIEIADLPVELLEEIFPYVVSHSDQVTTTSFNYRSPASPFSISHVCARWRCIALNLPHLWSNLFVIWPTNDSLANLVGEWINRAGQHPLHLSLRAGDASNTTPSAALAVLQVYLASIANCRSFEVQFYNLPVSPYLDSFIIPPQHLALLENLSITCDDPSQPETAFFLPLSLRAAGNLLSATWIGLDYLLLDEFYHSWVNLRELTLGSAQPLEPLLRAVSCCQELERLTLYKRIICPQLNVPTITLPRLTYLHAPFEPLIRTIFHCLITPSLKELVVLVGNYDTRWRQMATFLERSAATLEVLKVHEFDQPPHPSFNEERFHNALQMHCFANLKQLELTVPITFCTIVFLTLQQTPTLSDNNLVCSGHLRHLFGLSLTLSRGCPPDEPWKLTRLVASRVPGSIYGRVLTEFFKDWMMKRSSEEVTFMDNDTMVTFRMSGAQ